MKRRKWTSQLAGKWTSQLVGGDERKDCSANKNKNKIQKKEEEEEGDEMVMRSFEER